MWAAPTECNFQAYFKELTLGGLRGVSYVAGGPEISFPRKILKTELYVFQNAICIAILVILASNILSVVKYLKY